MTTRPPADPAAVLAGEIASLVERADFSPGLRVAPADWPAAARAARDHPEVAATFFDFLTAVDDGPAGIRVVAHLFSPTRLAHVLLETVLPAADPELGSLTGVFPGAGWHEREVFEMFGVVFTGHPDLRPLLLPDRFAGHPLRKDFPLAARGSRPWPGEGEPGGVPARRRARPPGRPAVEWPAPEAPDGAP